MILIDANILIYATNTASDQHDVSREWLDAQLNGSAPVGLPWPTLLAFLRVATNARAFRNPLTMAAAWEQGELAIGRDRMDARADRAALGSSR